MLVVSIVRLVANLYFGIFNLVSSIAIWPLSRDRSTTCYDESVLAFQHVGYSAHHFLFSLVNIITLGTIDDCEINRQGIGDEFMQSALLGETPL
jgi:hypothetical protein